MRITSAIVLLALATGTASAQSVSAKPGTPLPSITLAPELDRVLRDYEAAWRKGDAAALALLFTEDGLALPSERPPARGRAAIARAYDGQGGANLTLRAIAAETSGSLGYIIGTYRYDDGRGDVGKFTLTLRRGGDGRWLIVSDMDNASITPPRRGGAP